MAAADDDSSSYDTGTDSENESDLDEHRNSMNVWDLPNDTNTINRSCILKNVHRSQSTGYIEQKQQRKANTFQYSNPPQNHHIHQYAKPPPPPLPEYQSNNNQYASNPNMSYQMQQIQQQSHSVQYLHSAPIKKAYPIQPSQTMPTQTQMAYVQHSNSHQNLYQNKFNGNNHQHTYNQNHMRFKSNPNILQTQQHNKNNSFIPPSPQNNMEQHSNSHTNLYQNKFNGHNHQNTYNQNHMHFKSDPNILANAQKQQNNNNSFIPPSPQSNMEQQKFRDWKNKRKVMDDKKVNEKQMQQWLNSPTQNKKVSNNLKNQKHGRGQPNDYLQRTLKEGYMQKEGKFVKSWKKRWFVLRINGKMSYYKNQNAKKELSTIDCNGIIRITRESWGNDKKFGLIVSTPKRNWKFVCLNNQERMEWYQAFSGIMTVRR